MDLEDAILGRRSVRSFRPDPVPAEVLREILDLARWTPSAVNSQPWEFTIVGGAPLEELRRKLRQAAVADPDGKPEILWPNLPEPYRSRRKDVGLAVVQALGIRKEDKAGLNAWQLFGVGFFDAPQVVVVSIDRCFTAWGILDVGAAALALMLAAHSRGLGTCPQATQMRYPWLFHEILGIPEGKQVILAIPIGYPKDEAPVNRFARTRAAVDDLVSWKGFAPKRQCPRE